MTGKSPRKRVDAFYWPAQLRTAQAYLKAAQQAMLLVDLELFARWAEDLL